MHVQTTNLHGKAFQGGVLGCVFPRIIIHFVRCFLRDHNDIALFEDFAVVDRAVYFLTNAAYFYGFGHGIEVFREGCCY